MKLNSILTSSLCCCWHHFWEHSNWNFFLRGIPMVFRLLDTNFVHYPGVWDHDLVMVQVLKVIISGFFLFLHSCFTLICSLYIVLILLKSFLVDSLNLSLDIHFFRSGCNRFLFNIFPVKWIGCSRIWVILGSEFLRNVNNSLLNDDWFCFSLFFCNHFFIVLLLHSFSNCCFFQFRKSINTLVHL